MRFKNQSQRKAVMAKLKQNNFVSVKTLPRGKIEIINKNKILKFNKVGKTRNFLLFNKENEAYDVWIDPNRPVIIPKSEFKKLKLL